FALAPSVPRASFSPFFSSASTPPPSLYTLSLHDALPILPGFIPLLNNSCDILFNSDSTTDSLGIEMDTNVPFPVIRIKCFRRTRSEEHTSELQSRFDLVCRLLREKKKNTVTSRASLQFRH